MTEQRRIAPTVAMAAGIVGALALAALFPAFATGDWNRVEDPWERLVAGPLSGHTAQPTLLERLDDGRFLYVTEMADGGLMLGLVDERGDGLTCATPREGSIGCGTGDPEAGVFTGVRVERAPAAANGYRHELRTFTTETELSDYLGG